MIQYIVASLSLSVEFTEAYQFTKIHDSFRSKSYSNISPARRLLRLLTIA